MNIPTLLQYKNVISNYLSHKQIDILKLLYSFPNSSATAKQLAEALNYKSYHGANRHIGGIGEIFFKYCDIKPPIYIDRGEEKFAYFYFVGEYTITGWNMWDNLKNALENLSLVSGNLKENSDRLPTEILIFEEEQFYNEGKIIQVNVNRYERNQKARLECIKHYGVTCQGCGFDFENFYGNAAKGFIQVHHLVPLSEIMTNYKVDPIKDLVPLCANCHSFVHLSKPTMSIINLQKLTKKVNKAIQHY